MSPSLFAAKEMGQGIEIPASRPRENGKDNLAVEPDGGGNFLY